MWYGAKLKKKLDQWWSIGIIRRWTNVDNKLIGDHEWSLHSKRDNNRDQQKDH